MSKVIMVQGTMSGAGKSLLVAGLCRIFKQDGFRVAPFKSQNMALNSFITEEGLEMGRAQVMQAEAAGITPSVLMNPILLKPTNHVGSQVIVNGEVLGNMKATEYFKYKKKLIPDIVKAFRELEKKADIIVIEGAGSPAEINLRENDIVNMGMAELVDAPVLLVGDIDRGGVFAQLLGTLMLLTEEEKERVQGLVVNKFRGDKSILDPGIVMLEERGQKPVTGVVPYMEIDVEDEDSLTGRFGRKTEGVITLCVVQYPRISNFTDFGVFEKMEGVSVRYVKRPDELEGADLIFLPGSKNTMGDLKWMRENGLEAAIKKAAERKVVFGICGGYQMLGACIADPENLEEGGEIRGLELLPVTTILKKQKTRTQVKGTFEALNGILGSLSGKELMGYEIHMGVTEVTDKETDKSFVTKVRKVSASENEEPLKQEGCCLGRVYGSYIHGLFDEGDLAAGLVNTLAEEKGLSFRVGEQMDYKAYKEKQYDLLAKTLREAMDMDAVYGMLRESKV